MMTTLNTQQQLPELPPEHVMDQMLERTKLKLFGMKGAGFLGSLLCNHNIHWSEYNDTAWCDGSSIGFSKHYFMSIGPNQRVTLLAHELWHTGLQHMGRMGDKQPKRWNYAADYVINLMLSEQGFDFTGMDPLLDPQYKDMTTEQVYDLLPENPQGPGSGGEPDLSGDIVPVTDQKEIHEILNKVVAATQVSRMSKEAGVIPGETELIIDEFLNPILPWEILLDRFMTERTKDDYSWRNPSRRYEDVYLPSMISDNGLEHIIHYQDISGSVLDSDIIRFNSELKYIHTYLKPKRLTVVTFDTKIQDVYDFTDEEEYEKIVVTGRGGTSLHCVSEHIKEHLPTAAVIFSDLCCSPMLEHHGVDILWIVVDNKGAEVNFGEMIHIPSEG